MLNLKRLVAKYLREVADKLDAGTSDVTETEAMEIMNAVVHQAMSKEQACRFLHMGRSRFDQLIAEGKLPKGRKVQGRTGLTWYQNELNNYLIFKKNETSSK
jgi:predicted DNA-binding transcriptional regulator AlpA